MTTERISSPDGRYELQIQDDGHLLVYRDHQPVKSLWWDPDRDAPRDEAALAPIRGRIGFDGASYTDATGPRLLLMCHAGDLLLRFVEARERHDPQLEAQVYQAFQDMRDAGYSGLRSWTSIGWRVQHAYWGARRLAPDLAGHQSLLAECFRIGAEDYGLRWHVALGDVAGVPDEAIRAYWSWLTWFVQRHAHWFALVEGLNEAEHTGQTDPAVVAEWIKLCRDQNPQTLHVLSAGPGAGRSEERDALRRWTPDDQRVIYTHASRAGHWYDQMRHAFSVTYERPIRRNGWSGEPPGINWGDHTLVSGMSHAAEWTEAPWRYALYLAQTAISRQVPTFMCSHGVKLAGRLADVPAFRLAPELLGRLPADIMAFERFHGGAHWSGKRILAAPPGVRVDHAVHADGRAVLTVYPDGATDLNAVTLPVERAWTGMVYRPRGREPVSVQPGDPVYADITDGLLLIGRLNS